MKKAVSMFGLLALLFAAISFAAIHTHADSKTMTWKGWISDSHCGAKGMSADHKACAETCVKSKGASWVFVDTRTKKVIPIENQDAIKPDHDLGQEMILRGHLTDKGAVHVDTLSKTGAA
ncbi:MAG TPA: hypothetical protein VMB02_09470 [Candidatus Aquilonibacter sp.]|nr:hypothetical protein [Candidatus Aquilonibacter sp.]